MRTINQSLVSWKKTSQNIELSQPWASEELKKELLKKNELVELLVKTNTDRVRNQCNHQCSLVAALLQDPDSEKTELNYPWNDNYLKQAIRKKFELMALSREKKSLISWKLFRDQCSLVVTLMEAAKSAHYKKNVASQPKTESNPQAKSHQQSNENTSKTKTTMDSYWKFFCDACNICFTEKVQLTKHVNRHTVCGRDGCRFEGQPLAIQFHTEMVHETSHVTKVWQLTSRTDVEWWTAERKKHYPTLEKLSKLQAEKDAAAASKSNNAAHCCSPPKPNVPKLRPVSVWQSMMKQAEKEKKFHCDACEVGFSDSFLLDKHLTQHVKCEIGDCSFAGDKLSVGHHVQWHHVTGYDDKIWRPNSPYEIGKWRYERKFSFPKLQVTRDESVKIDQEAVKDCQVLLSETPVTSTTWPSKEVKNTMDSELKAELNYEWVCDETLKREIRKKFEMMDLSRQNRSLSTWKEFRDQCNKVATLMMNAKRAHDMKTAKKSSQSSVSRNFPLLKNCAGHEAKEDTMAAKDSKDSDLCRSGASVDNEERVGEVSSATVTSTNEEASTVAKDVTRPAAPVQPAPSSSKAAGDKKISSDAQRQLEKANASSKNKAEISLPASKYESSGYPNALSDKGTRKHEDRSKPVVDSKACALDKPTKQEETKPKENQKRKSSPGRVVDSKRTKKDSSDPLNKKRSPSRNHHSRSPLRHNHSSRHSRSPLRCRSPLQNKPLRSRSPLRHSPLRSRSPLRQSPLRSRSPLRRSPLRSRSPLRRSTLHSRSPLRRSPVQRRRSPLRRSCSPLRRSPSRSSKHSTTRLSRSPKRILTATPGSVELNKSTVEDGSQLIAQLNQVSSSSSDVAVDDGVTQSGQSAIPALLDIIGSQAKEEPQTTIPMMDALSRVVALQLLKKAGGSDSHIQALKEKMFADLVKEEFGDTVARELAGKSKRSYAPSRPQREVPSQEPPEFVPPRYNFAANTPPEQENLFSKLLNSVDSKHKMELELQLASNRVVAQSRINRGQLRPQHSEDLSEVCQRGDVPSTDNQTRRDRLLNSVEDGHKVEIAQQLAAILSVTGRSEVSDDLLARLVQQAVKAKSGAPEKPKSSTSRLPVSNNLNISSSTPSYHENPTTQQSSLVPPFTRHFVETPNISNRRNYFSPGESTHSNFVIPGLDMVHESTSEFQQQFCTNPNEISTQLPLSRDYRQNVGDFTTNSFNPSLPDATINPIATVQSSWQNQAPSDAPAPYYY